MEILHKKGEIRKLDWPIPFASRKLTVYLLLIIYHFLLKKKSCIRQKQEKQKK